MTAGNATITEGDALPTDLVSCTGLLDSLFQRFLRLRLSADWLREVNDMRQWMTRTE